MSAIHIIRCNVSRIIAVLVFTAATGFATADEGAESSTTTRSSDNLPNVQDMIDARIDVWGDAAMRQPDGASYEFFKDLLPPLRWVNTDFRHYPIVLSAPRAPQKARLVSNGSGVNTLANKPPMWKEQGVAVNFFVGDSGEPYGEDLARLQTPNYLDGYLPVVTIGYKSGNTTYNEEVFAPVGETSAARGAAMLRFSIGEGDSKNGRIEARIDSQTGLRVKNREVLDGKGQSLVAFGPDWEWVSERKALVATLSESRTAELAVFTKPTAPGMALSGVLYDQQKDHCIQSWKSLIDRSIKLVTPETIINDAWRALLVGNFMIAVGNRPNYSAGNAYDHLYEAECGDTLRSIMLFGHLDVAPAMLKPLLEFNRKATQFHVAGHKLQLLSHFYWITRDANTVRDYEPLWRPSVELILTNREAKTGLLPKDNYAGDINTKVYSLNSNANCWRGLRDLAAVLEDIGTKDEANKLRAQAADYRKAILEAVGRSERLDTDPPFIPVSLLGDEPAHDPLTATRTGSYYDLMCPYIIGSEIFGQGADRENWLLGYLQNHGGIAMGMIRSQPHQGQFKGEAGVNPLYGLRYQLALLRRDDRERALVGFYGQLAQGMTPGTFVGGEGSRFRHGDANGRSFYLPPNSTSNAAWLIALRYLLIQDWDLDEDGKPESLRLLFGVPRRWLADGKQFHIENAPTTFGRMSLQADSKLSEGFVNVLVTPPPRTAKTMLLRAPLPAGWKVSSVEIDGKRAELKDNSIDLSGMNKPVSVRFGVQAAAERRP